MKRVIVGTAGHIDHGKTALVKALTGIDADRLKEEKQRGITIDIGFADLDAGGVRFGFVDVPGHERFVKNMLAGAHGIDLVMLVVAADESVMPQTREHFDICRLLEIPRGVIALTKTDLAGEEMAQLVEEEVRDFVRGSFLETAPVLKVSSRTGEGIEELKKALFEVGNNTRARSESAVARLPIDRAFTIKGFGSVVTGTLVSGVLRVGDELDVLPGSVRTKVRGLQVHGRDTQEARAGERTAVNLQNVSVDQAPRGLTLVPSGFFQATSLIDAGLTLLPSAVTPVKQRSRVRLHIGTAEVMARVVILDNDDLQPGAEAMVQFRLESPVLAFPGDHFIVRSYSPQRTIGGGVVFDALPAKHKQTERAASDFLKELRSANDEERLRLFVASGGERGTPAAALAARAGVSMRALQAMLKNLGDSKRIAGGLSAQVYVTAEVAARLKQRALGVLAAYHEQEPLRAGMPREALIEKLGPHCGAEAARETLQALAAESLVKADRELVSLAAHTVTLSSDAAADIARMESVFERAGIRALQFDEALVQSGLADRRARELLQILISGSRLVRVGEFYFHRSAIEQVRAVLQSRKQIDPNLDVATFKDLTGTSRKHAIPLLEYFDAARVTRRQGSMRTIL